MTLIIYTEIFDIKSMPPDVCYLLSKKIRYGYENLTDRIHPIPLEASTSRSLGVRFMLFLCQLHLYSAGTGDFIDFCKDLNSRKKSMSSVNVINY